MSERFRKRISALEHSASLRAALGALNRGIEREALRVDADGYLAQTPHPAALGSKLTHPYITTDFSEAQPELITPVAKSAREALAFLEDIHRYVHAALGPEVLWSSSMPCMLEGDAQIPLAMYGKSNLGRLKTTYRQGLALRYGRVMQTICAVHYNVSLSDAFWVEHHLAEGGGLPLDRFRSARYFDLMRNLRRLAWLPVYLFGASPAVCNSFVRGRAHSLTPLDGGSFHAPFGTSLRNGNLGYQSGVQTSTVPVSYNSLDAYIDGLAFAITTAYEPYTRLGVKASDGFHQVSDCYLQSEAEFYTTVRAKCLPPPGVNFLGVLGERGVEYIEVRLLDVNPFVPLGIDEEQIHFLDAFLVYCLLEESPLLTEADEAANRQNLLDTVYRGRDSALELQREGKGVRLSDWAREVLQEMARVAEMLDASDETSPHARAIATHLGRIEDPDSTLSAMILSAMASRGVPYFRFAMDKAIEHRAYFRSQPLPRARREELDAISAESLEKQVAIEEADDIDFETYLALFHAGYLRLVERAVTV